MGVSGKIISGMTGFARTDGARGAVRWAWEARSVNGRGLDLKLKLPPGFEALEPIAREAAGKRFKRGSVQLGLSVKQELAAATAAKINLAHVEALIAAGKPFIARGEATAPRWDGLLALRGALIAEEAEPEAIEKEIEADLVRGMEGALDALDAARRQEGRALASVFESMIARIEALVVEARGSAAAAPGAIRERIVQRLEGLSPDIKIDPQRLAQEASLAAMRADVQEELERLSAHAKEARALVASDAPAGRRLDFLAQEFSREANTLCSKSQDLALTRAGLELKSVIDQFKEQAANVE
ncbi:MAG: YicC/YloC family endoribonuclease [Hyphomonadaceae bacterium]